MTQRIIPAIMSGGAGTRLWPLSTEDKPKQFHALMGARSMFAETVARVRGDAGGVSFAPPLVLCGAGQVASVRAALSEASAGAAAIVIEPAARNTAAVAAAAALVTREIDVGALVLLLPSDHVIGDVAGFRNAVARAAPFAHDRVVTFGVTPTRAATEYGYIKRGAPLGEGAFVIESFKEKPEPATARAYRADGSYAWNSGMFLFSPATLLAEFDVNQAIRGKTTEALNKAARSGDEIRLSADYAQAPSLPLDVAVMERTARAAVVPCEIGWADIGSWAELWRITREGVDGCKILGAAAAADVSGMKASGVKALAVDGDDLVVVSAPNGLLIAPSALARDIGALTALAAKL